MVGNPRLEIRQGQSMVMTPQMQQSIKMLQLSTLELQTYLSQQLEQNPLLETEEAITETLTEYPDQESSKQNDECDIADIANERASSSDNDSSIDDGYKDTWDSDATVSQTTYSENESTYHYSGGGSYSDNYSSDGTERQGNEAETLYQHITDQIMLEIHDAKDKIIAYHLTEMLDENGYIAGDIFSLTKKLHCSEGDIEKVLQQVQRFTPAGVFARSLSECLALQLSDRNHLDPAVAILLENLDLVAGGKLAQLQKLCGVGISDIHHMLDEIKHLNPKPANIFSHEISQTLQPDIFLKFRDDGTWIVELNSETLPKVLVNKRYYNEIKTHHMNAEEKEYISDQFQQANWLVRALDQRATTLLKVATQLVENQQDFFKHGIHHLHPMTLSNLAEAIEMHESTVSRATSHKYIATPMGVYEMRYFFSSALGNADEDGEDFSSRTVKYLIKDMIDKEDINAILSDESIATMLKEQGINVARRTVTKYREAMHIASSVQRRKEKRLKA